MAFFLPTIVATIYPDETTVTKQLYTVPPYVVGGFCTLMAPLISYKVDRRLIFIILCSPLVMVGYAMFLGTTEVESQAKVRYAATFLIASSAFPPGALTNAHISANVLSDTARSSAIGMNGMYSRDSSLTLFPLLPPHLRKSVSLSIAFTDLLRLVMFGNIGGLISTWSFVPKDGPNYPIGNGLNLATSGTIFVIGALTLFWMYRDNRKRDGRSPEEELAGLTQEQVEDLDWRHPGFRWAP